MLYLILFKKVIILYIFFILTLIDLFTRLKIILYSFFSCNIKLSAANYYPPQTKEILKYFAVSLKF